jgi:hypothetical protein
MQTGCPISRALREKWGLSVMVQFGFNEEILVGVILNGAAFQA